MMKLEGSALLPLGWYMADLSWFRDYLTGFSKRKKARKETAAARAEEKDRQARNEMRQEVMLECCLCTQGLISA